MDRAPPEVDEEIEAPAEPPRRILQVSRQESHPANHAQLICNNANEEAPNSRPSGAASWLSSGSIPTTGIERRTRASRLVPGVPTAAVQEKEKLDSEPVEALEARGSLGVDLWLHVYDLNETTGYLNNYGLKNASLGLFHAGVEVLGQEYFFGWGDTNFSGIRCNRPRQHGVHSYRESIFMGKSPFDEDGVDDVLDEVFQSWPECSYNPIHNNCTIFAEQFLVSLQSPEPFPEWVHGAAAYGRNDYLRPVVDWSWEWAKWMCRDDRVPSR
ncbi:DeSI-like protein At4g17486 [Durusdinium trenchii]|uniref:DeSI-like protein At4g17486 n=1 Tax=Durusdinium trenchii TaxID=1381693 RepID=A0ABP0R8D4_9DINO